MVIAAVEYQHIIRYDEPRSYQRFASTRTGLEYTYVPGHAPRIQPGQRRPEPAEPEEFAPGTLVYVNLNSTSEGSLN